MYELIILSFLARNSLENAMSGYLIAKIINDMIGPLARVSNGRLYPLLAKLEADGLIVAAGTPGERRQRAFRITDAGRIRFHQLMMDTTSNPGEYQTLFWYKVPFLGLLTPEERSYLIDHYTNYCQTHIFHLRNEMEDLKRDVATRHFMSQAELDATLDTFHHYLSRWQLELDDTQRLRERIKTSTEEAIGVSDTPPQSANTSHTADKKG